MTTTRTVLRDKDASDGDDLYMSFELGDKRWQMSIGDRRRCVSHYTVAAGDTAAVADCIIKAGARLRGWRHFANRRELAGCLGLVPTPYASGSSEIEQGISKAGNRRVRGLLVELAWSWLRLQPGSALAQWFNRRFAGAGKRMRRVGIVALARRLVIALWRYLQDGEIPAGARLKPTTAHA